MREHWSAEELNGLKDDVIALVKEYDLWYDTQIYVNGNRYCYDYKQPDLIRVDEGVEPLDYFEYVRRDGNIFAMAFEGPLYEVLNVYVGGYDEFLAKFEQLFEERGLYYEFGHAWNFSCYPIP